MQMRPVNAPQTRAAGTYSLAYEVTGPSRLLFISGQVALADDGSVPSGFEAQARLCFENLEAQLRAAHMTLSNIVRLNTFVVNRSDVASFRAIREEVFGEHRPASTLVIADLIDPAWLLEVEAVAAA